jgi:hypothetical protein
MHTYKYIWNMYPKVKVVDETKEGGEKMKGRGQ